MHATIFAILALFLTTGVVAQVLTGWALVWKVAPVQCVELLLSAPPQQPMIVPGQVVVKLRSTSTSSSGGMVAPLSVPGLSAVPIMGHANTAGTTGGAHTAAAATTTAGGVQVYTISDGSSVKMKVAQLNADPGERGPAWPPQPAPLCDSCSITPRQQPTPSLKPSLPAVAYAEPLYLRQAISQPLEMLPNDPDVPYLWWIDAIGAAQAWSNTTGSPRAKVGCTAVEELDDARCWW